MVPCCVKVSASPASRSRPCANFLAATLVPSPGRRTSSPSAASSRKAPRTVFLDAPKAAVRLCSPGNDPDAKDPARTSSRIRSASSRDRTERSLPGPRAGSGAAATALPSDTRRPVSAGDCITPECYARIAPPSDTVQRHALASPETRYCVGVPGQAGANGYRGLARSDGRAGRSTRPMVLALQVVLAVRDLLALLEDVFFGLFDGDIRRRCGLLAVFGVMVGVLVVRVFVFWVGVRAGCHGSESRLRHVRDINGTPLSTTAVPGHAGDVGAPRGRWPLGQAGAEL